MHPRHPDTVSSHKDQYPGHRGTSTPGRARARTRARTRARARARTRARTRARARGRAMTRARQGWPG